jgi:hypothetical protein
VEGELEAIERHAEHLGERAERCNRGMDEAAGGLGLEMPPAEAPGGEGMVPRRLVPGVLTLCDLPAKERDDFERITKEHTPMWSAVLNAALFWADGERSVAVIGRLVEQELGPSEVDLKGYFELLARLGYIEFRA